MQLFDLKSQQLSYSLSKFGKLWIVVVTSLFLFATFVGWSCPCGVSPARNEMERAFPWSALFVGLAVGGAALTGIRITDRPDDQDS
jgi:hypothetical protein